MNIRARTVNITTSTAGAFSGTFDAAGPLLLHVVYGAGSNLSSAADLSITDAYTGMTLLSAANFGSTAGTTWTPRRLINNAANGVESTGSYDYMAVNQQFSVSITGATAASQTGTLHLTFG